MPKTIFLIRHAETKHNTKRIVQGWLDIPLSSNGIQQARKLAKRLRQESIDVIYSSDLKRSLATAHEIAKELGKKVITSKHLREWNMGFWQGKTWDWVNKNYAHVFDELGHVKDEYWKEHNGESIYETKARIKKFINSIRKNYANKNVAVVTHGGTKRRMLDMLNIKDKETQWSFKNTSLTILKKNKDGSYSDYLIADTSHLEE